jgi:hypothetical protein
MGYQPERAPNTRCRSGFIACNSLPQSSEIRQIELQIARWQSALLSATEELSPKSHMHQKAANSRWNPKYA